jgi:hypothetical protein
VIRFCGSVSMIIPLSATKVNVRARALFPRPLKDE